MRGKYASTFVLFAALHDKVTPIFQFASILGNIMTHEKVEAVFRRAVDLIEVGYVPPDPDAPSCDAWRLRPSEEQAILIKRYLAPPPQWGIKINLSATFMGADKCVILGRKLIPNTTVTSIDLSLCDMQERGAVEFFSCLKRNKCVKHLNVDGNSIGDRGAIAASECIQNLETLHMSCNGIRDAGAVALASALRRSSKTKFLNLRGNRITCYGVFKLINALEPVFHDLSRDSQELISAKEESRAVGYESQSLESTKYSIHGMLEVSGDQARENVSEEVVHAKPDQLPEIFHSYKNSMWNEFFEHFYASSMCLKSVLPATFGDVEVAEVSPEVNLLTSSFDSKGTSQNTEGNQEVGGEDFSNNKESILRSAFELLRGDDERLNFALCEAVKLLKPSVFPLPLTEFAPLMFSNYPRYPGVDMRVEIKNTRYKKILNYLLLNSDLITVNEEKPGVFVVTHVNKSSDLLRTHKEKFEEFLRWFCYPAKEEESLKEEQQAFQDCKRLAFKRRIVSIEGLLSLQNREPMEVRRLLCVGRVDGKTDEGLVLGDEELMDNLYSQKDICRNLRNYIAENNLLQTSNQQKALPLVDLKLALACFSKTNDEKVTIVELERLILRRVFVPVWKITLETTPLNNGVATSKVAITHLHKKGELEKISLRTEKRAGNKVVTVVRGLEEYGFDLQSVANDWKHLFSTSCIINDSSKDNMRLKNGKKIPREIHLCGDWISKLQPVLKTDLGFPQHLIP